MPEDQSSQSEQHALQGSDAPSPEGASHENGPSGTPPGHPQLPPLTSAIRPPAGKQGAIPAPVAPIADSAAAPGTSHTTPVAAQRGSGLATLSQTVPQEVRKPKQDKPPDDDRGIWRMSRKNFLTVAGWFSFTSFLVTATIGAIRLMVPRVLYEAPSAFKAGFPQDYVIGEVNEKYKDDYRVWIVREQEGFYALLAICTHLGCTPRWLPAENKFKCPCHGSGYHKDGVNFEGPTPRPLERLKITLSDDGQILVDRSVKFLYEKQEWSKPDAFLKYSG